MDATQFCPVCGKSVILDAPQGLCPECLMKTGFETQIGNEFPGCKPPFAPSAVEEMAKLFPQLEIIELLGHGGMGAVYKARQPRLNRLVALKILSPEKQNDPQFAERFEREARALASLAHPNIVAVYDFGEATGNFYLLMEFVDGLSLRQLLQQRKLLPGEALRIVPEICEALQYAHDQGVVHRDIKPENILLDKNGGVKIADFGIAKILDPKPGNLSLTGAQDIVGTPHYMSPEQIEKPQRVDSRADIYSLGVVFYEMLTGELPLGKFPPPSQKVQVDARLDQVVLHALEKEPGRRYQKASEVKTDVETIATTTGHAALPIPAAKAITVKKTSGWKTAALVGGVFLVLLIGLLGAIAWLLAKTKTFGPGAQVATALVSPDHFEKALNEDQRLVLQFINRRFGKYFDNRTFDSWSPEDRAALEARLLDTIKGPRSDEYYKAINSLAALRSTNALRQLEKIAFERKGTLVHLEKSNRPRWMAVRAMGVIGDKTVVPKIIHLLYHNNSYVRWSAQISLVQLTGRNFGGDWRAWGKWWSAQKGNPPFNPEVVHWWRGQAEQAALVKELAEGDRKFLETAKDKNDKTDL
jgi:tRNA A-37 threonylcarbamoyl transferase component Bud32